MKDKRRQKHAEISLGQIPHETVNFTLDLEIEPGEVVLSVGAQVHARKRHPEDYDLCAPLIGGVVADPLYLGDDLRNQGKIEFVGRAAFGGLLVAVSLEVDRRGRYHVASFYRVSEEKISKRRQRGYLRRAQKKSRP